MTRGKNANGEGSKARRRKDGRYETRAVLDTATGRRRVSFYGATAKEANERKIEALANQNKGIVFSDPKGLKVAQYLASWLSDTARYQVSEGTYERYERTCRNHLVPFFGRLRLRDLTPAHVRAFKARKIEEGLNPNTVGVMQGVLSVALNQALDDGIIPTNPASRVKKAATRGRAPMRSLSNEEASRLISAAQGMRDEALIVVALRTGMRQGELAALRWEDLELGDPWQGLDHGPTLRRHPHPHSRLHDQDGRRAQDRHRSSHGRGPQGAPAAAARGADGCVGVAGPRSGVPQHAREGPPARLRSALSEEYARRSRTPRRRPLP